MSKRRKHIKKKKNVQSARKPSFYDDFQTAPQPASSPWEAFVKKHAYYQSLSIEELQKLLQKSSLSFQKDALLKEYEQDFSLDDMQKRYEEAYKDIWSAQQDNEHAADIEAFRVFLEKIIAEVYPRESSFDPFYLYIDTNEIINSSMELSQAVSAISEIIDRLLVMKEKNSEASLSVFQTKYGFDLPSFLVRLYIQYASANPSLQGIQKVEQQIQKLLDAYKDNAAYGPDLRAAILCCYASSGNTDIIDRKKQELLLLYPQEPYFVYYALLHGIAASTHPQLVKPYYEEAIKYMVFSADEQNFRDQITLIYKAYEQYMKGNAS